MGKSEEEEKGRSSDSEENKEVSDSSAQPIMTWVSTFDS